MTIRLMLVALYSILASICRQCRNATQILSTISLSSLFLSNFVHILASILSKHVPSSYLLAALFSPFLLANPHPRSSLFMIALGSWIVAIRILTIRFEVLKLKLFSLASVIIFDRFVKQIFATEWITAILFALRLVCLGLAHRACRYSKSVSLERNRTSS